MPLAVLATAAGWLVSCTFQGQMVRMSNNVKGEGHLKVSEGFPTAPGMMSGMQQANDDRFYIEVSPQDIIKQDEDLSIEWSRGGAAADFPVHTSGAATSHIHQARR